MTINGKWFRDKLVEKNRSQRKLAKHMGLDASAITLMFNGKRRMQMSEAREIASFLGEPLEAVLRAAGLPVNEARGAVPKVQIPPGADPATALRAKRAELMQQIDAIDQAIKLFE